MEANAWWLLAIPLFFGLGWLASRLDSAQLLTETRALPTSYFNGLNYLLADQPDKAIVAFEEVARLDPETAELYFALGQLFRRRGEAERAIRIHKNLLKRADLPAAQREQALFELARDFVAAGIFDHAEQAFAQLANTRFAGQAQRELARLYEKEANWAAAMRCAQAYLISEPAPTAAQAAQARQDLAHYACEQASLHLTAPNLDAPAAQAALDLAFSADASNPRLPFLQAQLAITQQDAVQGLAILSAAVARNPALTPLALQTAVPTCGQNAVQVDMLLGWALAAPSAAAVQHLSPLLAVQRPQDLTRLLNALAAQIKQASALRNLAAVRSLWAAADAELQATPIPPNLAHTAAWREAALSASEALIYRYDRPQCTACGFKANRHQWRCPGCGSWATLPYGV